ncbi:hypothetical protein K491DRAFT_358369 [Lophiostoma macrostomum CBS 122681]|uniref:Uncharacterized protein n=1 Tax=Lophiostoma macrostomum CBS 122681 TaxID=1314788 RepID=A0A6A6TC12_9PLEO|nr:hypothetical protein K491DRAFT_358369 [Lophiostoma macrostomum CBS 122681]
MGKLLDIHVIIMCGSQNNDSKGEKKTEFWVEPTHSHPFPRYPFTIHPQPGCPFNEDKTYSRSLSFHSRHEKGKKEFVVAKTRIPRPSLDHASTTLQGPQRHPQKQKKNTISPAWARTTNLLIPGSTGSLTVRRASQLRHGGLSLMICGEFNQNLIHIILRIRKRTQNQHSILDGVRNSNMKQAVKICGGA